MSAPLTNSSKQTKLTYLSLFSGIGGLDLGLDRAGFRCIGQVEIDPYCRAVLAKHWPDVPRFDDVRTFNAGMLDETPDLICGGFPCQDISSAGKKAGISGERSGLWSEFARIIRGFRPRFVLVENVAALLNGGIARVLQDLAESGFDAEWESLPAGLFGAPHRRSRVFVAGYANGNSEPVSAIHAEKAHRMPAMVANAEYAWRKELGTLGRAWRIEEPLPWVGDLEAENQSGVLRVDDGIPNRMDRLRTLGNAVVPQVAEWIGRRILEADALSQERAA